MSMIKIRLKTGGREIELEGERSDVDALLDKWWSTGVASDADQLDSDFQDVPERRSSKSKKRRRDKGAANSVEKNSDPDRDANTIANLVKQHRDFAKIEEHIIIGTASVYNKVAFICWIVAKPLTSGDIFRALVALGVKVTLPQISNVLKKNMSNFITSTQRVAGGPPAEYQLSAKANAEFEKWYAACGK